MIKSTEDSREIEFEQKNALIYRKDTMFTLDLITYGGEWHGLNRLNIFSIAVSSRRMIMPLSPIFFHNHFARVRSDDIVVLGQVFNIGSVFFGIEYKPQSKELAITKFNILVATEYNLDSQAETWQQISSYDDVPIPYGISVEFDAVKARWVRIDILQSVEAQVRMDEIEIYESLVLDSSSDNSITALSSGNLGAQSPVGVGPLEDISVLESVSPDEIFIKGSGVSPEITTATLSLEGIARSGNVDVVFAIDSSGSMGWNDPHNWSKTASKNFVDEMNPDTDQAGVVSWDSNVDFYQHLTNSTMSRW